MNTRQIELWNRIRAYPMDDPSSPQPFTDRLARENGWTRSHAHRVADEYKRFVLLCLTAGHPCTPSLAVDEAWHLHLIHTRSYWDDFCGGVLGQPLHHDPTRGGAEEAAKFQDWYARTLESYRTCFGTEPPPDVWGRLAQSPEPVSRHRSNATASDPATEPRRLWNRGFRWAAATALAAVATGILWWWSESTPANAEFVPSLRAEIPWADYMPVAIAVVVVGSAIKFFSGLGKRHRGGGGCGSGGGGGCSSDSSSHSSHGGSGPDGGCGDGGGDGGGGCDGGGSGCGGGGCGGGGGD